MEVPDLHLTKRRRTETLTPSPPPLTGGATSLPPSSAGKGKAKVAAASSPPSSVEKVKMKVENDGAASSPPSSIEKGKVKVENDGAASSPPSSIEKGKVKVENDGAASSPPSSIEKGKVKVENDGAASSLPFSIEKERVKVENDGVASSPPSSIEKGKEKIEDGGDGGGDAEEVCGICLLEGGRAVRGRVDSCDHFFCFVCIMEWAKIESRCPMCKGRFQMIHRPQVPGVFPCERVVVVPHRNQIMNNSKKLRGLLRTPFLQHVGLM